MDRSAWSHGRRRRAAWVVAWFAGIVVFVGCRPDPDAAKGRAAPKTSDDRAERRPISDARESASQAAQVDQGAPGAPSGNGIQAKGGAADPRSNGPAANGPAANGPAANGPAPGESLGDSAPGTHSESHSQANPGGRPAPDPTRSLLAEPVAGPPIDEVWMAYYLGTAKVGHAVTRVYEVAPESLPGESPNDAYKRTEMEQVITLLRNGDRVTQQLRLASLEYADGRVAELGTSMSDGGPEVTTSARRDGPQLHVVLRAPGSSSLQSIPWNDGWRGFFADQQVLSAKPLAPGDRCAFTSFIPVLNIVGETTLSAVDWEEAETPFGRERLLRIDSHVSADQLQLDSTLWCDALGIIRKYHMPQADMTAYRTVRELALAANVDVDLYAMIHVTVSNPIPDPHHKRNAVYRARLKGDKDPSRVFVNDGSQSIARVDRSTVDITVRRVEPGSPDVPVGGAAPGPADLEPNSLIQSDDEAVRRMAEAIDAGSDDAWALAAACERTVHQAIERKALTEAFASAAEVVRSRTGDCTEHAVLLAALCRARKLPARVATGLVAFRDGYAFHMWNEVWIRDRWVPLDATLGLGGVGVGHIKLGISDLNGVSPFAALAPVLEVMGSLELDVVSFEQPNRSIRAIP